MDPPLPGWIGLCALVALLVVVVVWDVRARKIPNLLVAAIAAGGLLHAVLAGGGRGLLGSFAGLAAGLAVMYLPARARLAGAADWKLAGALGAWCGVVGVLYVVLYGTLLNGFLALAALLRLDRAQRSEVWHNVRFAVINQELNVPEPAQVPRHRGVPFGVSLAVTAVGFLFLRMR